MTSCSYLAMRAGRTAPWVHTSETPPHLLSHETLIRMEESTRLPSRPPSPRSPSHYPSTPKPRARVPKRSPDQTYESGSAGLGRLSAAGQVSRASVFLSNTRSGNPESVNGVSSASTHLLIKERSDPDNFDPLLEWISVRGKFHPRSPALCDHRIPFLHGQQ